MSNFKKKLYKNSKGFTLAEVMITVAIIVVLIAVAAPNVVKYQKSLKQMELNKTAEEVFLAVQNTMTDYKSAGTFDAIVKGSSVKESASAYPGKTEKVKLYSFGSDSECYKQHFANPALSVVNGSFSVEFYKETCEVYRVIYAEDSGVTSVLLRDANAGNSLDSYPASESTGSYGGKAPTLPSDYYEKDNKIVINDISIEDGNELKLKMSVDVFSDFLVNKQNLNVKLTFSDGTNNAVYSFTGDQHVDSEETDTGKVVYAIPLDSLQEPRFYSIDDSFAKLSKGKNLTVTADVNYTSLEGVRYYLDTKESRYKTTFNPLFDIATNDSVIYISWIRHLNNLSLLTDESAGWASVSQLKDIEYADGFEPVSGALSIPYEGNNQAVKNMRRMMFAEHSANISNVVILNPVIVNVSGNAGSLVGKQSKGTISNCRVYVVGVEERDQTDYHNFKIAGTGDNIGGLIGFASGTTITNSFAAIDVNGTGGFAGALENCTVSSCYSSGKVTGTGTQHGGFAAVISGSGSNISSCYTTSDVETNNAPAAGFACSCEGSLSYCYSFGRLLDASKGNKAEYAEGNYAGFALNADGVSDASCYFMQRDFEGASDSLYDTKKYTSNNGYNEFVDSDFGIGRDYWFLTDNNGQNVRYGANYDSNLNDHNHKFPFGVHGFNENIPHYGNWPHNYVISDEYPTADSHTYVCAVCGNKYPYPCHYLPGASGCDVCDH